MANLTPGDVIKQLQAGSHAGLYYLYGKDVAGVAAFTKRLIKSWMGMCRNMTAGIWIWSSLQMQWDSTPCLPRPM